MRTLVFLTAILYLYGCTTEPIDPPLQMGSLTYKGNFQDFKASKIPVPECSAFEPNEIFYRLIRPANGGTYSATSAITIEGNQIFSTEPMTFPEGTYQVDEVSLRYNGIVTHTAPQETDPRFNFAMYVDNPLPYTLEIVANETTIARDQVMCYTEQTLIDPNMEWIGELVDLQTLYFYVLESSCILTIELVIDGYPLEMPIIERGLFAVPIPVDIFMYELTGYNSAGVAVQVLSGTEYNPDGVLDENDILILDEVCE